MLQNIKNINTKILRNEIENIENGILIDWIISYAMAMVKTPYIGNYTNYTLNTYSTRPIIALFVLVKIKRAPGL